MVNMEIDRAQDRPSEIWIQVVFLQKPEKPSGQNRSKLQIFGFQKKTKKYLKMMCLIVSLPVGPQNSLELPHLQKVFQLQYHIF